LTTPLRIGLVSLTFSPGFVTPFPGVNRYAVSLAETLATNGCQVRVVTPRLGRAPPHESWRGIEIVRLRDSKSLFGKLGVVGQLNVRTFELNLLRHPALFQNSDVVQTDLPLLRIRRSWPGIPLISMVHHVYRPWNGIDVLTVPFGVMYQRAALKRADAVVAPSTSAAADIAGVYRVPTGKIRVIHHGVNASLFHPPTSARQRPSQEDPSLLYVGLLESRKGVDDLIPIFSRVHKEIPASKLTIVGNGPMETELRRLCWDLGLGSHVVFRSKLDDQELASTIGKCGVFLLPSRLEGFGLVAAEAMACARPLVAYDSATNREVIGDAGILVAKGDISAFSDAIVKLVRRPDLSIRLGERGRQRVMSRFDWNASARQYIDLYKRLLTNY